MKNIDVLYIHPSKYPSRSEYGLIPVGVFSLVNQLRRKGYIVKGINHAVEIQLGDADLSFSFSRYSPNIVLIDMHWYEHAAGALYIASLCRQFITDCKIVIGGITASYFAWELIQKKEVDYVIVGDADEAISRLCDVVIQGKPALEDVPNLMYKDANQTIKRSLQTVVESDLDPLDFTSADWLHNEEEYYKMDLNGYHPFLGYTHFWLCVGRGCIFNCSYCGGTKEIHSEIYGRPKFLTRSPRIVTEDIVTLLNRGITRINLSHDISLFGQQYWTEFFKLLTLSQLQPGIYMEVWQLPRLTFAEHFSRNTDSRLSKLAVAPLSGNETVRKINGKNYDNEKFWRFLQFCASQRVQVDVYFSSNLPGETKETFQDTINLTHLIQAKLPQGLVQVFCQPHTIDPGAPMFKDPDKYGILRTMDSLNDYIEYCKLSDRTEALGYVYGTNDGILNQQLWDELYKEKAVVPVAAFQNEQFKLEV